MYTRGRDGDEVRTRIALKGEYWDLDWDLDWVLWKELR
jgi:hypothetical protein